MRIGRLEKLTAQKRDLVRHITMLEATIKDVSAEQTKFLGLVVELEKRFFSEKPRKFLLRHSDVQLIQIFLKQY